MVFVFYTLIYADRANIGVVLPLIQSEFKLSNFEAGSMASLFFLGYAVTQIPAGFWYSKFGVRGLISMAIVATSAFTGLIGMASSAFMIKVCRFGLGLAEGPCPIGAVSTINNWFPPKEKGTATGIYIAATKFAPVIVPPISVWIMLAFGWREVFYLFALPGILVAAIWHFFVRNHPEESPFCSSDEITYIKDTSPDVVAVALKERISLGWLDWLIRAKNLKPIETNAKVFLSWNIWADTLGYFLLVCIVYGLLTWVPSYLVKEKHFSFINMGFVASAPWVGAVLGAFIGGYISDKLFDKRRKPLMLIGALATTCMMIMLINIPRDPWLISAGLFSTGFFLSFGYSAFTAYPMGLTNEKTFPVAIAVVNSGGNLGGFFSPMIAGYLLDVFSYSAVFIFFGTCAVLSLLIVLTMDEPI